MCVLDANNFGSFLFSHEEQGILLDQREICFNLIGFILVFFSKPTGRNRKLGWKE